MTATEKIDLGRLHKNEYVAPKKPVLLNIAPAIYLGIAGSGGSASPKDTAFKCSTLVPMNGLEKRLR
jgi:hypothetical protein